MPSPQPPTFVAPPSPVKRTQVPRRSRQPKKSSSTGTAVRTTAEPLTTTLQPRPAIGPPSSSARFFQRLSRSLFPSPPTLRSTSRNSLLLKQTQQSQQWTRAIIALLVLSNCILAYWSWSKQASRESSQSPEATSALPVTPEELARLLVEDVEYLGVRIQRRHVTTGHGMQGFVLFSSSRTSSRSFVALGLSPVALHALNRSSLCRWEDNDGTVLNGTVSVHFPGEAYRHVYEAVIFLCDLKQDIPSRRVATRENPIDVITNGGQLVLEVDQDQAVLYQEAVDTQLYADPVTGKFPHTLACCVSPIHRPLRASAVGEWMHFHSRLHGAGFFSFYDAGGMDYDMGQVLEEFWSKGMVEVRDIRDTLQYDTYQFSEVLAINDCLYRTRWTAKWTLFLGLDQYLSLAPLPAPKPEEVEAREKKQRKLKFRVDLVPEAMGQSLLSFLELQGLGEWGWVSLGSFVYSVAHCAKNATASGLYNVEKMWLRDPEPYCRKGAPFKNRAKCLKGFGLRKFVVNPRVTHVIQLNRVFVAAQEGYNAPTYAARINYFQGMVDKAEALCSSSWKIGEPPQNLAEDSIVAQLASYARQKT